MKTILTTIAILAALTISTANTVPVKALIFNESVVVMSNNSETNQMFSSAEYNPSTQNIEFDLKDNVDIIQIFNTAGELEIQLPVMSNKVSISKAFFEKGTSQLGFLMSGKANILMTSITID